MLAKIRGAMAVTVAASVGSTALLAAADLNYGGRTSSACSFNFALIWRRLFSARLRRPSASMSDVAWVSARNHALGDPELAPAIAEAVQKSVVQDLIEIANGSWKGNRGDTEETRTKAAIKLKERLQWRGWEEIQ